MSKIIYTLPVIPKSNNKYLGRLNVDEYREDKQIWASYVMAYCRPRPRKPIPKSIVKLMYYFPTAIRHDPDNYSGKFILDGLVQCRIIEDDCFGKIKLLLDADIDRVNPRTEITLIYK